MKYQLLLLFSFFTFYTYSQETTGILKGIILNSKQEKITIILTQKATGFKTITLSQKDGYYEFNQLKPANDYEIEITNKEFFPFNQKDIQIILGNATTINIDLELITKNLREVVIEKSTKSIQRNSEKNINSDLISKVPTLNRSIQDATRLIPEANLNSFGGANYRYNNLSIDGSATNDVLGFQEPASGAAGSVASGTPGGLAGTQPIGFGAISAISIKTAPFDVTLGNFTGANINLVSKNGTNKTSGNVYNYIKNKILTGNYVDGKKQNSASFLDNQMGASIGGPILKNKLFYFFNSEFSTRTESVLNAPGSEKSNISSETIEKIANKLLTQYNYNPGEYKNANIERKNTKLFLRLDYNISENQKLTLRNNFVTGFADNLEWTPNLFNFGNQGYRHNSTTNSIVGELKTKLSTHFSNKLTVSFSTVNDERTFNGRVFPHLEIIDNTANTIFAGTYREASVYGLTLNTTQFTDNITIYKEKHKFTLGTSSEINDIQYRFLTAFNGRWQYKSVTDFLADKPNRIRGVYNINNTDFDYNKKTPSAEYTVVLSSLYFQDEIRLTNKLNVLAGIRLDWQNHPGDFPLSNEIKNTSEFEKYKNKINNKPQLNPRVGFSYNIDNNLKYSLKGGTGLFSGRIPFVWYAYPHYISGTNYYNIDIKPTGILPITENLSELEPIQNKRLTEINLVDTNFSLPRDWKSNIVFDAKLKNNYTFTLESTYTKVLKGLFFQSINRKEDLKNTFDGPDNRPYYTNSTDAGKINKNVTNVFLLTNTNQGFRYNFTLGITKTEQHFNSYFGYTYGLSKDISSTNRNSHAANFEWNQSLVANNPELTYSNFDLRHKFVSYSFYNFKLKSNSIKIGLIYNGKSGNPFSFVYEGDVNRDGSSKNDVLYVPRDQSEIELQNIVNSSNTIIVTKEEQWNLLNNYINNDSYLSTKRGQYAERNGARTPWNHQVDTKITAEIPFLKNKLEFSLDIFNVGNLINKNWGAQHYVPNINNSGYALLDFIKIENNKPVYQFNNPQGRPWLVDAINSRWQAQFGIQYSF